MATNLLQEIIRQCMLIDRMSVEFYNRLAAAAKTSSLRRFWNKLAVEGGSHDEYWNQLLLHARSHELPQVFDDPQKVSGELAARLESIKALIGEVETGITPGQAFSLAYRLESYKLHPAFRTLFRNFYPIAGSPPPTAIQDATISRFSDALKKYGEATPELKLVGETLQMLWEQNRLLAEQAAIDELSTLLNRRGFLIVARQMAYLAKRNKTPLTIMMTDIKNFRRINEQHGNVKGDEVIRSVAMLLKKLLRGSDLIARYSADDFVALLPETTANGGQSVEQKLQREMRKIAPVGIDVDLTTVVVQANIIKNVEAELQELLRQAEYKLFLRKSGGA